MDVQTLLADIGEAAVGEGFVLRLTDEAGFPQSVEMEVMGDNLDLWLTFMVARSRRRFPTPPPPPPPRDLRSRLRRKLRRSRRRYRRSSRRLRKFRKRVANRANGMRTRGRHQRRKFRAKVREQLRSFSQKIRSPFGRAPNDGSVAGRWIPKRALGFLHQPRFPDVGGLFRRFRRQGGEVAVNF